MKAIIQLVILIVLVSFVICGPSSGQSVAVITSGTNCFYINGKQYPKNSVSLIFKRDSSLCEIVMTPTYGCNTALQPVVSYGLVSKYRRSDSSSHTYSSLIAYYDSFMVKR